MHADETDALPDRKEGVKVNPVADVASSIGIGVKPWIGNLGASSGVHITNLGGLNASSPGVELFAGPSVRVGAFPASPSALGSFWSQKSTPFSASNLGAAGAGVLAFPGGSLPAEPKDDGLEASELPGVAASAWDFAERLGTWAQSFPDRATRNVLLNCGAVLISLAGAVVAAGTGGAILGVAAAWAIFYTLALVNSVIEKLQD